MVEIEADPEIDLVAMDFFLAGIGDFAKPEDVSSGEEGQCVALV